MSFRARSIAITSIVVVLGACGEKAPSHADVSGSPASTAHGSAPTPGSAASSSQSAVAQPAWVVWRRVVDVGPFADDAWGVALDARGHAFLTGGTWVRPAEKGGRSDAWVGELDEKGEVVFLTKWGDPDNFEDGRAVALLQNGEFVAVGVRNVIGVDASTERAWIARFDGKGKKVWEHAEAGTALFDVGLVPNGDVVACGVRGQTAFIVRYAPDGNRGPEHAGGQGHAMRLAVDAKGNVHVAGESRDDDEKSAWVATFGEDARPIRSSTYGAASSFDSASGVALLKDGKRWLLGTDLIEGFAGKPWLRRLDAEGKELWSTREFPKATAGPVVATADDGAIACVNVFPSEGVCTRFDPSGAVVWTRRLEFSVRGIALGQDGGPVLAGGTTKDAVVVKMVP